MVGQGLDSSDNLCIPEPGQYLALSRFKSCISNWQLSDALAPYFDRQYIGSFLC